jgi:hypothetical protein
MFVPVDGCQGKTWLSHANVQSRDDGELAIREHLCGISRTRSILVTSVRVIRISAGAKVRVINAQIDSFD